MTRKILNLALAILLSAGWLFAIDPSFATNGSISGEIYENGQLTLTAPEGQIFTGVDFASYGLPINYTINPDCHADFTSYATSVFIGQNTGTLDANNSIAGDPCPGIGKNLQVTLSYSTDPNYVAPKPQPKTILTDPTSPNIIINGDNLDISWSHPDGSTVSVERYAIMWFTNTTNGWGIATGNVGDPQSLNTFISIPIDIVASTDGYDKTYYFMIRADNDTMPFYSNYSGPSSVLLMAPIAPTPTPKPSPTPPPDEPSPAPAIPVIAPEPSAQPTPAPSPSPEPTPPPKPEPTPAPSPSPEPTPPPKPEPSPIPAPPEPKPTTAPPPPPSPEPAPSPSPEPKPEPIKDLKPNNPDQLPTDKPKEAPKEALVPHIQEDKAGVENGGIEFFGTKDQPQVVQEDGSLTPPPPPPGSGLPIPPEAITLVDTFIGQPGGTTFNAPDVAVPIELIEVSVPAALDAIPGAGQAIQAVNAAYVALANIGNDMSPVTRKKAKKILVTTIVVGQIAALRRRF